jgi:hypothetical protein
MIETFDQMLATDKDFRYKIARLLQEKGVEIQAVEWKKSAS